ncbi:unnamed protein product, partial [Chrysoparadoxa australica]
MWCCCAKQKAVEPPLSQILEEKLAPISLYYPGTEHVSVMDSKGSFILGGMPAVVALRRGAKQFASTLDQERTPILHITGSSTMFHCYDVGQWVLSFYSHVGGHDIACFDTIAADKALSGLLNDLKLLS